MNVRKQRTHQCGLTNVDYRTKGDQETNEAYHPTLKFADFGTMTKSNLKGTGVNTSMTTPADTLKNNGGWQFAKRPDPKSDTAAQYYKD